MTKFVVKETGQREAIRVALMRWRTEDAYSLDQCVDDVRRAMVRGVEWPKLPTPWGLVRAGGEATPIYTTEQVREYARSAIAASGNPATEETK